MICFACQRFALPFWLCASTANCVTWPCASSPDFRARSHQGHSEKGLSLRSSAITLYVLRKIDCERFGKHPCIGGNCLGSFPGVFENFRSISTFAHRCARNRWSGSLRTYRRKSLWNVTCAKSAQNHLESTGAQVASVLDLFLTFLKISVL